MIRLASAPNRKKNWLGRRPRHEIHAPEKFRAIIDRVKARVGRNHHVFSFVTLSANGSSSHVKALIETAVQRLRVTDIIGYVDTQRIGILLPDTSASGAHAVAKGICAALESESWQPGCDVSVYPPDKTIAAFHDDPRQLRLKM